MIWYSSVYGRLPKYWLPLNPMTKDLYLPPTEELWLQIISNESCAQISLLTMTSIYGNAEPSFFQRLSRVWRCMHFFSRLTFFWLMPILKLGYHMPLEMSDLTPLPSNEKVICLKILNSKGNRYDKRFSG